MSYGSYANRVSWRVNQARHTQALKLMEPRIISRPVLTAAAKAEYLYTTVSKVGTDYFASVTPGTINGIVPDNIFSDMVVAADDCVFLTLTTDGKSITAATLTADSMPDAPLLPTGMGQAPGTFYVPLALIHDVGGGKLNCYVVAYGNIVALPKQVLLTPKASAIAAGAEAFDRWWTWVVKQPA